MRLALSAARLSLGSTAPNPAVGAVLVKEGRVIGTGRTQPVGGNHAEIDALRDARARGELPAGATLYVTVEPCCHHGRTPPCTNAILEAGLSRVVVGTLDPFESMRGASLILLRRAGVEVLCGVLEREAQLSILGFSRAITLNYPEVTIKTAVTADGAVATRSGESQWITGEEARAAGQQLRREHDAILVGIGTVLADNPRLTCRLPGIHSLVPVVLDTSLRLPVHSHLNRPEALIYCAPDAFDPGLKATVVRVPISSSGVDIHQVLKDISQRGLHRVLVEGGAEVNRSLLTEGLVDTVEQFIAGKLVVGGKGWVGGDPIESLSSSLSLTLRGVRQIGCDAQLSWSCDHRFPPTFPVES